MFKVSMSAASFLDMDVGAFMEWCKEVNIEDDAWNFIDPKDLSSLTPETFWFKHEEDAIAFRLRFGK